MILIYTNKGDIHCNPVIEHLSAMGKPHLRINTESLLSDYEFAFSVSGEGETNLTITCHRNGIHADTNDVISYWDRRPHRPCELFGTPDTPDPHEEACRVALEEAAEFAVWMRHMLTHVYSIGSPILDPLAECKLHQFAVAASARQVLGAERRIGIPETLIANRKRFFQPFLHRHGQVAVKPVTSDGASLEEGIELPFLTHRLASTDLLSLPESAFAAAPTLVQPYIAKSHELRITAVGYQTFCCRINSMMMAADRGGIDWRAGYTAEGGIPQEAIECDPLLHDFCLAYLDKLALNFGCFDFIVDASGTPWFLECNPNGQWMWIEEDLGLPISRAIAECLARGSST